MTTFTYTFACRLIVTVRDNSDYIQQQTSDHKNGRSKIFVLLQKTFTKISEHFQAVSPNRCVISLLHVQDGPKTDTNTVCLRTFAGLDDLI